MNHKYCSTNSGISQETELEKNTLYSSENNLHSGSTSFTKCANLLHNPLPELAEGANHNHHNYPLSIIHYSLLIVLCLLFSVNAMAEFGGGTGTEGDPYIISSITHLNTLADNVNGGSYHYEGVYFKVTDDITSTAVTKVIGGGGGSKYFSGIFDGNNKRIKLGINITTEYTQYIGLFGYIKGATIKNVKVEGTLTSAKWYAGSIAGYATDDCVIENCYSSVTVTVSSSFAAGIVGNAYNTTITDCTNTGNISGTVNVGGISGNFHECTVSNCSNTGVVTGTSANWLRGGIVGNATSSTDITNCSNTGNVIGTECIGGIVGNGEAITVANCFNRGAITGNTRCIGGIVGKLLRTSSVKNCYNTGAISGGSANAVAGIVGQNNESAQIQNCYSGNTISTSSTYKGGVVGEHYMGTIDHCYYRSGDGVSAVNYNNGGTTTNSTSFTHTNGYVSCTLQTPMSGQMLDALNDWVDDQPGNDYLNWSADNSMENRGMPIFKTCTPISTSITSVTSSHRKNVVEWTASPQNATCTYSVSWTSSAGNGNSSATSPFNHTGLTNDVSYCYRVVAIGTGDYCDVNEPSAQVCGTPHCTHLDAPTLYEPTTGDRTVTVSWETVSGALSYRLNYGSNSSNMWEVTPDSNPYTVLRLTNDQTYNFKIKAVGDEEHCGEDNPFSTPLKQATPNCP